MMDDLSLMAMIVSLCLLLGGALGFTGGQINGSHKVMHQAYERGYMVECLGKEGYYWECPE